MTDAPEPTTKRMLHVVFTRKYAVELEVTPEQEGEIRARAADIDWVLPHPRARAVIEQTEELAAFILQCDPGALERAVDGELFYDSIDE